MYLDAGIENVKMKLFKEDRHVILKETDKQDVMTFINDWLNTIKKE